MRTVLGMLESRMKMHLLGKQFEISIMNNSESAIFLYKCTVKLYQEERRIKSSRFRY